MIRALLPILSVFFLLASFVRAEDEALFPEEREPASQAKSAWPAKKKSKPNTKTKKSQASQTPAPKPRPGEISAEDSARLRSVDDKYQKAKTIAMKVDKTLKIGLLGEERKSSGSVWISEGRIRMELEGSEKSMLVVNKKNLWAVTYPGPEFPDAPVQVIRGDAASKKGAAKNAMSLFSVGGFLKLFKPTEVKPLPSGARVYTLMPKPGASEDFKKAQVSLTSDGKAIAELKYWDPRDNETQFVFRDVDFGKKEAFGKKFDNTLFDYDPPKNAEVMNL